MRHGLQASLDCQRDLIAQKRLRIAEAPRRTWKPNFNLQNNVQGKTLSHFLHHTLRWLLISKGHADEVYALNHQTIWTSCFPGDAPVKNLPANAGDTRDSGVTPGLGRSPGEGNGNQLQCSCLEKSMDRGAWWAAVHRVKKSWTRLKWLSIA